MEAVPQDSMMEGNKLQAWLRNFSPHSGSPLGYLCDFRHVLNLPEPPSLNEGNLFPRAVRAVYTTLPIQQLEAWILLSMGQPQGEGPEEAFVFQLRMKIFD